MVFCAKTRTNVKLWVHIFQGFSCVIVTSVSPLATSFNSQNSPQPQSMAKSDSVSTSYIHYHVQRLQTYNCTQLITVTHMPVVNSPDSNICNLFAKSHSKRLFSQQIQVTSRVCVDFLLVEFLFWVRFDSHFADSNQFADLLTRFCFEIVSWMIYLELTCIVKQTKVGHLSIQYTL